MRKDLSIKIGCFKVVNPKTQKTYYGGGFYRDDGSNFGYIMGVEWDRFDSRKYFIDNIISEGNRIFNNKKWIRKINITNHIPKEEIGNILPLEKEKLEEITEVIKNYA